MLKKTFFVAIVFTLFISVLSSSIEKSSDDLNERYRKWLEEEVVYIITMIEKNVFSQLETDKERNVFIEAFWKHRDPTPGTPENEFKRKQRKGIAIVRNILKSHALIYGKELGSML